MKKGRFLWSAHRITERQKAGKARNIKGKQLKNSRNTASKPLVAHRSSPSAKFPFIGLLSSGSTTRNIVPGGFLLKMCGWQDDRICEMAQKVSANRQ